MYDTEEFDEEESRRPNKTQLKREADALFELGKRLAELEKSTLQSLDLPNQLVSAIDAAKDIHSNIAIKRQHKLIGKMLRSIDTEPLKELVEKRDLQHKKGVGEFHQVEKWRDKLIAGGSTAVTEFLDRYPSADRQKLNQLVRGAAKEAQLGKPPKSSRQLFRFLRESMS